MWTAAVDYLRLTHRRGEGLDYAVAAYASATRRVGSIFEGRSVLPRPWSWMGYYGNTLGGVSYGEGPAGAILQVSGIASASVFDLRLPWSGVPRIDIQATFWYESDRQTLAQEASLDANIGRVRARGKPASVRLISGFGDGDTLYIGKRGKQSKFLRVYDKWRESGRDDEYKYAWRFEAELTDGHGRNAMRSLEVTGQTERTVLALLSGYYAERGLTLPAAPEGGFVPVAGLKMEKSSTYRRLMWLQGQVRPAIDKLIASGVPTEEIRAILGLTRGA